MCFWFRCVCVCVCVSARYIRDFHDIQFWLENIVFVIKRFTEWIGIMPKSLRSGLAFMLERTYPLKNALHPVVYMWGSVAFMWVCVCVSERVWHTEKCTELSAKKPKKNKDRAKCWNRTNDQTNISLASIISISSLAAITSEELIRNIRKWG